MSRFDDVEELIGQLVGACSSTRFWSGLPEGYPGGFGIFQDQPARELVAEALAQFRVLESKTPTYEPLTHNHDTMTKVYGPLKNVGLSEEQIISAVNEMQNNGIFFREAL